jgi:hypothetical protein
MSEGQACDPDYTLLDALSERQGLHMPERGASGTMKVVPSNKGLNHVKVTK